MRKHELVAMLRQAGHDEEANRIASVTPEDEARFENWLSDPVNKQRWDEALRKAQR